MPIEKHMYHPKWTLIVRLIKHRAGNCCEECGIENHVVGYRAKDGSFHSLKKIETLLEAETPEFERLGINTEKKPVKIICTTAHLDQNRRNNRFNNLKFLCQRCHFGHDRKANVRRKRYGKYIFDVVTLDFSAS